jgi:hypothetical protein
MRRSHVLIGIVSLALAGSAAAAWLGSSVFLGAPPGVPIPNVTITLPAVKFAPGGHLPAANPNNPFAPSLETLLFGDLVITTEAQMKQVWGALFSEAYDSSQFNFDQSFVVWMGGGAAWYDSFGISNVEQVDATYPGFGFGGPGGTEIDRFLSVTSFEFVPGIMPSEPPPGKYRVSAVRIRKDLLDDVVFHRMIAYGV